ncbi:hypothetical protein FRB93_002704 [Tulasnella sp. JGI-2019a]|nr:hypothetical protein FRB93_002704 [Tulasnella sp. JGI-2019a]
MTGQNQQARRLSQRRGSMAAPDPFLQHEVSNSVSSSSRITIVRVPSGKDSTPPSPGVQPRDGFPKASDRDPSTIARRSSWGSAKSGSSETSSGGRGRGRMTFAFSTFTPIEPPPSAGGRPGVSTPDTSGPPSPVSFKSKHRTFSNHSLSHILPPRAAVLSPQQLYEVAQQATHPGMSNPMSPVYGYGGLPLPPNASQQQDGGIQPAPFVPLPSEVFLPFIHRPQEVCQLLATPQTGRLFALLSSTFPQEAGFGATSRPSSSMGIRPQHTGGSVQSLTHVAFSEIPEDARTWTFTELSAWIRFVTRQEANDREWVRKIRLCINSRSEVLWQRFAGALGVPPGFEDEEDDTAVADEEDFSGSESRFVGIGRTVHSDLGPQGPQEESSVADNAPDFDDSGDINSEFGDFDDDYDDSSLPGSSAVIEPITASSLPLPPSASGLTSPPVVPTLSAGEMHALSDLREEEEEAETSAEKEGTEGGLGLAPNDGTLKSPLPKHMAALSSPGALHEYVPRTPSPLASSATLEKKPSDHDSAGGRPSLHLATPPTSTVPINASSAPDTTTELPSEDNFDFGEPDPNAEAIQGLRIMNAPMKLFGTSPAVPSRLNDNDEAYSSSPAQLTSPHHVYPVPQAQHVVGLPAVPGSNRQRAGSNSSIFRAEPRYRTQSFGAYHTRRMSGNSMSHGHLGAAGLTGNAERGPGNPLFPTSFAGLGIGPTLSVNNPRLRHPAVPTSSAIAGAAGSGRHAGISLGTGMHHTPRAVATLRHQVGLGKSVTEYAVSESEQ